MGAKPVRTVKLLAATAALPLAVMVGTGTLPAAATGRVATGPAGVLTVATILSGSTLTHSFVPAGGSSPTTEVLRDPDDITVLGHDLFVGFQNGVGPQGQPSPDGNTASTIVELTMSGDPLAQWDVTGKCDGLTADPQAHAVIATVNEDANSSLYVISPSAAPGSQVAHYAYSAPLPHDGGTDAISDYHGQLLISASAPGTTGAPAPQPGYPAVYTVTLDPYALLATAAPLFYDEDSATAANAGSSHGTVTLALTDPDSNEVAPQGSPRFAGEFVLDSQGDQEQIYVHDSGHVGQSLSVLSLSQSIDDTAWPVAGGRLFTTDSTYDAVDVVTGHFGSEPLVVATPCGANSAPPTCPAPGYPANYLASLNLWTGVVSPVSVAGAAYIPQGGLAFVPGGASRR
jgi:hypothetical protein